MIMKQLCNSVFSKLMLTISFLALNGCTSLLPLKEKKEKTIQLQVITSAQVNPDMDNQASPIQIDIYQVVKYDNIMLMDYFSLINKIDIIKDDVLVKNTEIIRPNSILSKDLILDNRMKYLVVVAHYQDIENSQWKTLFKLQDFKSNKKNYLFLNIDKLAISQVSKKDMRSLLITYAKANPNQYNIDQYGRLKNPKANYAKGVFLQKNIEPVNVEQIN